ncbi:MAG: oleate hydratase [Lachnospiraceae bacterium]|nr:oleate hydratase [Lachnospiraceae bacterium]
MNNFLVYLQMLMEQTESRDRNCKTAYVLGGGVCGLAVAYMLVSKSGIPGRHIHILEKEGRAGGKMRKNEKKTEQYVLPFLRYLQSQDVRFHYDTEVRNVFFGTRDTRRFATQIEINDNGREETIGLTDDDHVFSTIGTRIDAENYVSIERFPVSIRDRLLQTCKREGGVAL